MIERVRIAPPRNLQHLVHCYWHGRFIPLSGQTLEQQVLPSPFTELIFHTGEHSCSLDNRNASPLALAIGMQQHPYTVKFIREVNVIGIRLRAGAHKVLLGISGSELRNAHFDLYTVDPVFRKLGEGIRSATEATEAIRFCNRFFEERVNRNRHDDVLSEAINYLHTANTSFSMETFRNHCRRSLRQTERIFRNETGCSPREYMLLLKSLSAARVLESDKEKLVNLAYHLDYADQAHFTRTYKKVFGILPSRQRASPDSFLVNY